MTRKYVFGFTCAVLALSASLAPATLVTNGTFDADTDWTKVGTAGIGGGRATLGAGGNNRGAVYQTINTVANRWYKVTYDKGHAGSVNLPSGLMVTAFDGAGNANANGYWGQSHVAPDKTGVTAWFQAQSNTTTIQFRDFNYSGASHDVRVDNASVVTGTVGVRDEINIAGSAALSQSSYYTDTNTRPVVWYDTTGTVPACSVTIVGAPFDIDASGDLGFGYIDYTFPAFNAVTEVVSVAGGDIYTPCSVQFHTLFRLEPDSSVGTFGDVVRVVYTNDNIALYREDLPPNILQAGLYDERWKMVDALRVTPRADLSAYPTSYWHAIFWPSSASHANYDDAWTQNTTDWIAATNAPIEAAGGTVRMHAEFSTNNFGATYMAFGWTDIPVTNQPFQIVSIPTNAAHSAQLYIVPSAFPGTAESTSVLCDLMSWFVGIDGTSTGRVMTSIYSLMETQAEAVVSARYSTTLIGAVAADDDPVKVAVPSLPVPSNDVHNVNYGVQFDPTDAVYVLLWDGTNGFTYK